MLLLQDYRDLLATHHETGADVTIATHSVGWGQARLRGLARVDPDTGESDMVDDESSEQSSFEPCNPE